MNWRLKEAIQTAGTGHKQARDEGFFWEPHQLATSLDIH
jgi:hypothetical protein